MAHLQPPARLPMQQVVPNQASLWWGPTATGRSRSSVASPSLGPASSRSLQICFHPAGDFVGLQPQTAASTPPWEAQRGPSPAHLCLADSSTRSGRLDTSSEPAAESAVALDVRQARPCTLPQAGWPRSPPRCVSQGGACLLRAQPRGPAPAASPAPPSFSQHHRPAAPPLHGGQPRGWNGRRQSGRSRVGREFQTLLGLLLLPLHQLPTLGLGIGICCPESRPHGGRPYSRSLKSPLFPQHFT